MNRNRLKLTRRIAFYAAYECKSFAETGYVPTDSLPPTAAKPYWRTTPRRLDPNCFRHHRQAAKRTLKGYPTTYVREISNALDPVAYHFLDQYEF